jgi:superfamily I DNA and/or RNA helicase
MLSHPELNKFANVVPLHTVIFDEASQIEVGDYLPLLHRFQRCLQKLVFIGDDKQRENWVFDPSTRVTDLDLSGAIRP